MKFTQLFEKSADISEIYQLLSKYCQPFKTETDNFNYKYIPLRMIGSNIGDEYYDSNTYFKLKTKVERASTFSSNDPTIYKWMNEEIVKHGHSSRIKHAVSCSTKGYNTLYPIEHEYAFRLFPVGKYTYSYVVNDFNHLFNLNAFKPLFRYLPVDTSNISLSDMVSQAKEELKMNYANDEYMLKIKMYDIQDMEKELSKINEIHSSNYKDAFKMENEIWFNCEEYIILNATTFGNLVEYINKAANN